MLLLRLLEARHQSGHAHARRRHCSVLFRLYSEIFREAPCLPDPRSRISLALVAGIVNRHKIISQDQTSNWPRSAGSPSHAQDVYRHLQDRWAKANALREGTLRGAAQGRPIAMQRRAETLPTPVACPCQCQRIVRKASAPTGGPDTITARYAPSHHIRMNEARRALGRGRETCFQREVGRAIAPLETLVRTFSSCDARYRDLSSFTFASGCPTRTEGAELLKADGAESHLPFQDFHVGAKQACEAGSPPSRAKSASSAKRDGVMATPRILASLKPKGD